MSDRPRLPLDQALVAAKGYLRSGLNWREIGPLVGYGHNTLRAAWRAQQEAAQAMDAGTKSVASTFAALGLERHSK